MAREHLHDLGLDPGRVDARVEFLEAYANTALRRLERALDDAELLSPAPRPVDEWALRAEVATALREAGQWCLYREPSQAVGLLRRSGEQFVRLGSGFGLYLAAVAARPQADEPGTAREHQRIMIGALRTMVEEDRSSAFARFVANPPQQAYALCAAAATPEVATEIPGVLRQILDGSVHRTGVIPVGALGTPIHRYWALARELVEQSGDVGPLAAHLGAMAVTYAETMELAQVNTHLWANCAAAVDVGDIDIAGLSTLIVRNLGPEVMEQVFGIARHLSDIARAPLQAGLDVARIEMGIELPGIEPPYDGPEGPELGL